MRDMHINKHKGLYFSITARPIPGGQFQATFTVHGADGAGAQPGDIRVEEWNPPQFFQSEHDAINAAMKRAREWIDDHSPEE